MYNEQITLQGFKSYRDHTVVGTFGRNLIYKGAGVSRATIPIAFDNSDKSKSPPGFEDFQEIIVSRVVDHEQLCKYYLNSLNSTKVAVSDIFQHVGININHPNFIIMQGKITKVVNIKPMKVLQMIEKTCGATAYLQKRDRIERQEEMRKREDETNGWIRGKLKFANDDLDPTNLNEKVQKHANFQKELLPNKTRIDEVVLAGQTLIDSSHYGAERVGSRLEEIMSLWQALEEAADKKESRSHQERIDLVRNSAKEFLDKGHFDKDNIKKKADAVEQRYAALMGPMESRRKKLSDSLRVQQLFRDIEDEEAWIREKEPIAGSNNRGRDLIGFQKLIKKHQAVVSEISNPRVNAVYQNGIGLGENEKSEKRKQDLEDVVLDEDSSEALLKTNEALMSNLEAFKSTTEGLREKAQACKQAPPDVHLEQGEVMQKKFDDFQSDLKANEVRLAEMNVIAMQFMSLGHTEAAVNVQTQLEDLNTKWNSLQQVTQEKAEKLESAYQIQKFHRLETRLLQDIPLCANKRTRQGYLKRKFNRNRKLNKNDSQQFAVKSGVTKQPKKKLLTKASRKKRPTANDRYSTKEQKAILETYKDYNCAYCPEKCQSESGIHKHVWMECLGIPTSNVMEKKNFRIFGNGTKIYESPGVAVQSFSKFIKPYPTPEGTIVAPLLYLSFNNSGPSELVITEGSDSVYCSNIDFKNFEQAVKVGVADGSILRILFLVTFYTKKGEGGGRGCGLPNISNKNHAATLVLERKDPNEFFKGYYLDSVTKTTMFSNKVLGNATRCKLRDLIGYHVPINIYDVFPSLTRNGCMAVAAFYFILVLTKMPLRHPPSNGCIRGLKYRMMDMNRIGKPRKIILGDIILD